MPENNTLIITNMFTNFKKQKQIKCKIGPMHFDDQEVDTYKHK